MWLVHREAILHRLPLVFPELPLFSRPRFSRELVMRVGRRVDHLDWTDWTSDAYWTGYTRWSDGDDTNFFPRERATTWSCISGGDLRSIHVQEVYNSMLDFWEAALSELETYFRSAVTDIQVPPRTFRHLDKYVVLSMPLFLPLGRLMSSSFPRCFSVFRVTRKLRPFFHGRLGELVRLLIDGTPLRWNPPLGVPDPPDSDEATSDSDDDVSDTLPSLSSPRPPRRFGAGPVFRSGPYLTHSETLVFNGLWEMRRLQQEHRRTGSTSREHLE